MRFRVLLTGIFLFLALQVPWWAGTEAAARCVIVLPAVGSINPGLAEFIISGIHTLETKKAEVQVI